MVGILLGNSARAAGSPTFEAVDWVGGVNVGFGTGGGGPGFGFTATSSVGLFVMSMQCGGGAGNIVGR